jgi:hypothetical protein
MFQRRAAWASAASLALLSIAGAARAEPDLSGVWTLASPPMTRPGAYADLPLAPQARAKVDAHRALVDPLGESPGSYCLGAGMPETMMGAGGYPMEVIQNLDQVTIINELHNDIRRIFLGDRIADDADIFPDRNGYSKGRWEGDVLVVETTHLKEQVDSRYPHSASATIVERFALQEAEDGERRLVADTTVTDPEWWTASLEYRLEWRTYPLGRLMPYDCTEPSWLDHLDVLAAGASDSADGD